MTHPYKDKIVSITDITERMEKPLMLKTHLYHILIL